MILSNVVARLPQQDGARESTRNATAGRATHNAMRTRLLAVTLSPIVLASSAPSIIIVHLKSKEAHIFLLRSSRMKHQTQAMKPYVLSQAAGVARQLRLVAPPAWVRAAALEIDRENSSFLRGFGFGSAGKRRPPQRN